MSVEILLGSYNGEKYIEDQIDSILSQTISDIVLLVRDDGSTDRTIEIIKKKAASDKRIKLIEDNYGSLGVGENFKALLRFSKADYVLFSDQDDIWLPNKIEVLLNFAKENFVESKPSLVYSFGRIVDEHLNRTDFVTDSKLSIARVGDMMISNGGVQGCAMLFNREMVTKSLMYDIEWHMHDQVITLIAVTLGNIFYLKEELFLYRQHSYNVKGYHNKGIIGYIKKVVQGNVTYLLEEKSCILFKNYLSHYGSLLNDRDLSVIIDFLKYYRKSKSEIIIFILKNRIRLSRSISRAVLKVIFAKTIFAPSKGK